MLSVSLQTMVRSKNKLKKNKIMYTVTNTIHILELCDNTTKFVAMREIEKYLKLQTSALNVLIQLHHLTSQKL